MSLHVIYLCALAVMGLEEALQNRLEVQMIAQILMIL